MRNLIAENLTEAQEVLAKFIADPKNIESIESAGKAMIAAIKSGGKIISCGNGGSMCDAMHFAEELSGRFRGDRKALPAPAISDPRHLPCPANDCGYEQVFSRYIEAQARAGDCLLAISTSGTSRNVVMAAEKAK